MSLRVVFMGTPDFSVPTLAEITGAGHEVVGVYTRAPKAAGRGMAEKRSPVHEFAIASGLDVYTPSTLKNQDEQQRLEILQPDVIVVVAYGLLLPQAVLDIPVSGCLNLHGSLLPRWRGAAPIQRALMAGDDETGVMVMKMEAGLDTGPVAMMEKISISDTMTAQDLHDEMMRLGADLMHRALGALQRGGLSFTPQNSEGVTYAHKIEKAEARIDFTRSAQEVHNHIRGLSPFPGAWFDMNGERVKILRSRVAEGSGKSGTILAGTLKIACGSDAIEALQVQPAGKKPMSGEDFMRGRSNATL